eukprot:scaffold41717_cov64-Phaeocystis_antarctica.AAC.1
MSARAACAYPNAVACGTCRRRAGRYASAQSRVAATIARRKVPLRASRRHGIRRGCAPLPRHPPREASRSRRGAASRWSLPPPSQSARSSLLTAGSVRYCYRSYTCPSVPAWHGASRRCRACSSSPPTGTRRVACRRARPRSSPQRAAHSAVVSRRVARAALPGATSGSRLD